MADCVVCGERTIRMLCDKCVDSAYKQNKENCKMDEIIIRFTYGIDGDEKTYFNRDFTFTEIEEGLHLDVIKENKDTELLYKKFIFGEECILSFKEIKKILLVEKPNTKFINLLDRLKELENTIETKDVEIEKLREALKGIEICDTYGKCECSSIAKQALEAHDG